MCIALRVSGAKVSERFVRNVDCLKQNDSYTYVTAMKLNNWDALPSETWVKHRLEHAIFTFDSFHLPASMISRNARWEHQCRYSDKVILGLSMVSKTLTLG